jgi:hypothetical protein
MDKEIIHVRVNNGICEAYGRFKKAITSINVKLPSSGAVTDATAISKHHIADYSTDNRSYQICLDDTIPDSIKKDNDLMMSCPDRICAECGNDHSFRGNFEGVITSIDLIPELLYGMKVTVKEVKN